MLLSPPADGLKVWLEQESKKGHAAAPLLPHCTHDTAAKCGSLIIIICIFVMTQSMMAVLGMSCLAVPLPHPQATLPTFLAYY